ncbi:SIR2 family protein [Leptospira stimsonii]|uniref:Uncharacterized protein n=1 Tax=Leptospira stimsonii TaxID=2202203 RepID=A0A396Z6W6_9LEPT|nr:SIR2 family protein [Leptospira stimsonii]RHX89438.1 hypothetical protein DLM75_16585 [Leptospira stimsonii]
MKYQDLLEKLDSQELVVLLGAGASIKAGMPGTKRLTTDLYESIKQKSSLKKAAEMYAFVVTGIMHQKSIRGEGILEIPNIEEVVSAIKLIYEREDLEARPFISSWNNYIEKLDRGNKIESIDIEKILLLPIQNVFNTVHDAFSEVIKSVNNINYLKGPDYEKRDLDELFGRASSDLKYIIEDISNFIRKKVENWNEPEEKFAELYHLLHLKLIEILNIKDVNKVQYLSPLIENRIKKHIFTLNYDNTIEEVAKTLPKDYCLDDGFEIIDGYETFTSVYNNESINKFYKLHGSINYFWQKLENRTIKINDAKSNFGIPSLIFGQREKLNPDSLFLDLLFKFSEILERSKNLIVIGYGFQDKHINRYIRKFSFRTENVLYLICGESKNYQTVIARNRCQIYNLNMLVEDFL